MPPSLCPAPQAEIGCTVNGNVPYGDAEEQAYGRDGGSAEKLVKGEGAVPDSGPPGSSFSSTFHLWESCKEVNAS